MTILTSVLQSLRLYLPTFTLSSVLAELKRLVGFSAAKLLRGTSVKISYG